MNFHQNPAMYVDHVHVFVSNLEQSRSFYEDLLGFAVYEKSEHMITFTANQTTPLFTVEQPPSFLPRDAHASGLYHIAFLLPHRGDVGSVLQRLEEAGYPLQGGSDHLVSEALYISDPDGNGIEIYSDRDPQTWKWENGEVEMATKRLDTAGLIAEAPVWRGMPTNTIIGHIHLQVAHIQEAEAFYGGVLGFDVVCRRAEALFLSSAGYHHHIGLNIWHSAGVPAPTENRIGLQHFTLHIPNEEEVTKRLRESHAWLHEEEGSLFTKDPAGNTIRLRFV